MTVIINSLPPGFRFHPTDEELIHYLKNKLSSSSSHNHSSIIAEIDLYKLNPWELPDRAYFGDSEWFCFSPRQRKYPNGDRPNRTTASGYWKATGTDKPILSSHASQCLGVKKVLSFDKGRAPKGTKTNWMMHEYRLSEVTHVSGRLKGSIRLDDWVLCRIRHKGNLSRSLSATGQQELQQFLNRETWDRDLDCAENRERLLNEALESIKRVLSLGALEEQLVESPNKRSCSINSPSGCSGSSTIFEISSSSI